MSERRRMLMAIANQFKWLPYSYTYLYHSLIPTTISGKNVKNKAKVSTIYGNSVVENQLVQNGNFEDTSNWSGYNGTLSSDKNILSYAITYIGADYGSNRIEQVFSHILNHKYLVTISVKCPYNTDIRLYISASWQLLGTAQANQWTTFSKIIDVSSIVSGSNNIYLDIHGQASYQVGDVIQVKEYEKIDLTQAYPFDTPTTLTDNRVQALLNRGYIAYNSGTLKSVDIGEFSSEPYNLFDGELEIGSISSGVPVPNLQFIRSKNFIKVRSSVSYTIKTNITPFSRFYFEQYDENQIYIKETSSNSGVLTLESNCKYIKFLIYSGGTNYESVPTNQTYVYETSVGDLGYKPHTQPQTISFKYQGGGVGTSHDTMEIGKDNVVFEKNIGSVDLGTLTFTYNSSRDCWYANITNAIDYSNYCLCDKYNVVQMSVIWNATQDKVCSMQNNYVGSSYYKRIVIRDTSIIQASDITGTLEYQLATPQVITIPRKHLGIVDLGTIGLSLSGGYWRATITNIKIPATTSTQANIYCSAYLNDTYSHLQSQGYMAVSDSGMIYIKDSTKTQASDFSGIYLFYETQNEVADILDTINIEAGGTLKSVDCEVLCDTKLNFKCK